MSFTLGIFLISRRAIFHARCTTHDNDRSRRAASSLISWSIDSGKYRLCLRLSLPVVLFESLSATSTSVFFGRWGRLHREGRSREMKSSNLLPPTASWDQWGIV